MGEPRHHIAVEDAEVYAAIGEDGFLRLVAAFYAQIPSDDILGPMYPSHDLAGAEARLRDFLVGRFGGPPRYIEARGHPRLRIRHAPFPVTPDARDRWLLLMHRALDHARLPPDAAAVLHRFFDAASTMLINHPADAPGGSRG